MSNEHFWSGFEKRAALKFSPSTLSHAPAPLKGFVPRIPFEGRAINYKNMLAADRAKKMEKFDKKWKTTGGQGGTMSYGPKGAESYTGPGAVTPESKVKVQQKLQTQSQNRMDNATKGGYTHPQFERVGLTRQDKPTPAPTRR